MCCFFQHGHNSFKWGDCCKAQGRRKGDGGERARKQVLQPDRAVDGAETPGLGSFQSRRGLLCPPWQGWCEEKCTMAGRKTGGQLHEA